MICLFVDLPVSRTSSIVIYGRICDVIGLRITNDGTGTSDFQTKRNKEIMSYI